MHRLAQLYHPITGTPFQQDETYREAAPCLALQPYIRCFWGSARPLPDRPSSTGGLVIPDTCMDIIFHIDYVNNRITGSFCTLDEHSYRTPASTSSGGLCATFAIRFYAWSACLFAEDSLRGHVNEAFPAYAFFRRLEQALLPLLFREPTLDGKIRAAEPVLLALLHSERADADVLNAIHHLLRTHGRARIGEMANALALSTRQLERRFDAVTGVSPKTFSSLVRYQMLWQDMVLSPRFDALDAVEKFGYTDQAHLLNDFRKRHLMSPGEAVDFARR